MDTIQKFCDTKNPELLHHLPYNIKQFFIQAAKWAINEPAPFGKPFGHGYVIDAALLGIAPEDYID
jgi:hypothetical protein